MTMREIAFMLIQMGKEIKFTKRDDGGIRITYINGQRFTGSKGNEMARQLVGATISEARLQQLKKIKTPKKQWGHKKADIIDEETKKFIRKLQRKFRKKGHDQGIPSIRLYRQNIRDFGKTEADRLLKEDLRYIEGLAYTKNIEALISRLLADNEKLKSPDIDNLIIRLKRMTPILTDDALMNVYNALYDLEQLGRTKGVITINDVNEFVRKANSYLDSN